MADLPRIFPGGRRFEAGIGSLDAYDERVSPLVEMLKRMPVQERGTPQTAQAAPQTTAQALMGTIPKPTSLKSAFEDRRKTYQDILGSTEDQKNLTQAQILFDVANAALMATQPGKQRESMAQGFARGITESQLLPRINERVAGLEKSKRELDLAALQSAESQVAAEAKAAADARKAAIAAKPEYMRVEFADGSEKVFNVATPFGARGFETALQQQGAKAYTVSAEPAPTKPSASSYKLVLDKDGKQIGQFDTSDPTQRQRMAEMLQSNPSYQLADVPTAPRMELPLGDRDYFTKFGMTKEKFELLPQETQNYLMGIETITDKDYFTKFGMDKTSFLELNPNTRNFLMGLPVLTDQDYFAKFGMPKAEYEDLRQEDKNVLLGLPQITDEMYFTKFGMTKERFMALDSDVKNRLLDITVEPELMKDARGRIVDVTNPEDPKIVWDIESPVTPKLQQITIDGVPTVVDINTTSGSALLQKANEANKQTPGRAQITNVSTEPRPLAFLIDGKVRTSFDNGRTYTVDGEIRNVPDTAFPVSNNTSYDVHKNEQAVGKAGKQLEALDNQLAESLGANFTNEDINAAKDVMEMARNGTGFWSNMVAVGDAALGLLPNALRPEFMTNLSKNTQAGRQYLRGLTVLARSALVVNPRFPVAEMNKVEQLFVKPENFFVNPDTEANKLSELKGLAMAQYRRNLQALSSGELAKDQRDLVQANNFELQRLMSLMPGVPTPGMSQGATDDAINAARAILQNR